VTLKEGEGDLRQCHQITQDGGRELSKMSLDIFCLFIELFLERKEAFHEKACFLGK